MSHNLDFNFPSPHFLTNTTAIYGNIGTVDCAAMTLTLPVQALTIGALNGLAQAAAILIGKALGSGEDERAYQESKN